MVFHFFLACLLALLALGPGLTYQLLRIGSMIAISGIPTHFAREVAWRRSWQRAVKTAGQAGSASSTPVSLLGKRLCETDINVVEDQVHQAQLIGCSHVRNETERAKQTVKSGQTAQSQAPAPQTFPAGGAQACGMRSRGFNADTGPCCCVAQDTRRQHQQ